MDDAPAFGLNRFDWTSTEAFVADIQRAEEVGWDYALIPWNPLSRRDPYMELAIAAGQTSRIKLGLLLDNPVLHHPAVSASSIATLDIMSGGRAFLTLGVGDTAVRWLGLRPARMAELEEATVLARRLLAGEAVDVDALRAVARTVNDLREPERAMIVVTHYQRILNYITPDFVHILVDGRIVRSGDAGLAEEVEDKGYEWVTEGRTSAAS